jgi:endogenous inhibitor of DNA gyrase (YacG/DUF329 family)
MKIIKKGDKAWPLSITNACVSCGTTYQLENVTEFERHDENGLSDRITSVCPVCNARVVTHNPNIARPFNGLNSWRQP